eukprot:TRINITY_DN13326_c0_g1_i1.p1 TRINITY_DN13326_c0_g1~~TRINITY_DN13326_c0_g1_i1.p1  ORF type:complete len:228 (+),score=96.43 TRINITY_DN13326_c0_g1_i1:36-719(+)
MDAPREPKPPTNREEIESLPHLTVVLEAACLETVKKGNAFQLLNCDDHAFILRKANRSLEEARPDITHQCLLTLLDSPLNKSGRLQIYIHTKRNALIKINPRTRIPRTFKRFSGLMVQLLHKMSIRAADGDEKLLQIVKNPVTDHLPLSAIRIGLSAKAEKLTKIDDYVMDQIPADKPVVFVVGAFSQGEIEVDYVSEELAISPFSLSASVVCGKLCDAFERKWGIF